METYENGQDEKQKNVTVIRVSLLPHTDGWRFKTMPVTGFLFNFIHTVQVTNKVLVNIDVFKIAFLQCTSAVNDS